MLRHPDPACTVILTGIAPSGDSISRAALRTSPCWFAFSSLVHFGRVPWPSSLRGRQPPWCAMAELYCHLWTVGWWTDLKLGSTWIDSSMASCINKLVTSAPRLHERDCVVALFENSNFSKHPTCIFLGEKTSHSCSIASLFDSHRGVCHRLGWVISGQQVFR